MKICFVINKLYDGGAERVVSVLCNNLINRGMDIEIVRFESKQKEYDIDRRVKKTLIDYSDSKIKFVAKTLKYLKNKDFDIVIGFDILPNIMCSALAIVSNKNIIISERNAPKHTKLNIVLKIVRQILYPFSDRIVFQTQEARKSYRNKISKKGVIIKNPVIEGLPERSKTHNKEIIALGRLTQQKNYNLLLAAAKKVHTKHPDYIFKLYGQGDLKEELNRKICDLCQQEYVFLEGYFPNVYEYITKADIYILTSIYEGMPNSLIEAMCMGFPVIASDCPSGGPRELIEDRYNGLLFKNNDVDDCVNKINYMIENEEKKEAMALHAKELGEEVSVKNIVLQWINLFKEIKNIC